MDANFIIFLLYVDDILIVGLDVNMISRLKGELAQSFIMKNLGEARHILGMQIVCDRKAKRL